MWILSRQPGLVAGDPSPPKEVCQHSAFTSRSVIAPELCERLSGSMILQHCPERRNMGAFLCRPAASRGPPRKQAFSEQAARPLQTYFWPFRRHSLPRFRHTFGCSRRFLFSGPGREKGCPEPWPLALLPSRFHPSTASPTAAPSGGNNLSSTMRPSQWIRLARLSRQSVNPALRILIVLSSTGTDRSARRGPSSRST
jgi:hypothetical protein